MKIWTATYTHSVDECWSITAVGHTKKEATENLLAKLNGNDEPFTWEEYEEDGSVETEEHTL